MVRRDVPRRARRRRAAIRRQSTISWKPASVPIGTASATRPKSGTTMPARRFGSPLSADGHASEAVILGTDLAKGERPQAIVPANWWQAAETSRRLHAGRLHGGAGFRVCKLRNGAARLETQRQLNCYSRGFRLRNAAAQDHRMCGKDGTACHEKAGDSNPPARLRKTEERQDEGGKQRRCIACGAKRLNVAVLDAVVPGIEGSADRKETKADNRDPLQGGFRPDGCLQRPMAEQVRAPR